MTSTGVDVQGAREDPLRAHRRITRPRGLPGGRAVVGALLIAAAAVTVFAAYLDATSEPSTRFLVASEPIPTGTVIADLATAEAMFSSAPLALVDAVAEHAVTVDDLDGLVGHTVVATLEAGELIQRSALLDGERATGAHVMSFAVPVADAVAGSVSPGETIDVLATSRSSGEPTTVYVVRGVPVLAVGSSGPGSSLVLTVALSDVGEVQALGHAVHTATVFVVSTVAAGEADEPLLPAPYRGELHGGGEVGEAPVGEPDEHTEADRQDPEDQGEQGTDGTDEGGHGEPGDG